MRKTREVTISAEGRDQDKRFLLTEMPSLQAEKWAMRAMLAIARSGVEIPDDISDAGIAGIAALGFRALSNCSWDDLEPLIDEMFGCVQFVSPAGVRSLLPEDIEEIATRVRLRVEVFQLHVDFSQAGAPSQPASGAKGPAPTSKRSTSRET